MSWMDSAACRPGNGHDPNLWFDGRYRHRAQQICSQCPVQGPCRQLGRDIDAYRGVWGGEVHHLKSVGHSPTQPYIGYEHGTNAGYSMHMRDGSAPCTRCRTAHNYTRRAYEAAQIRREVTA